MFGCLRTLRKQPIVALYFEFENELKWPDSLSEQKGCNADWLYKMKHLLTFQLAMRYAPEKNNNEFNIVRGPELQCLLKVKQDLS